MGYIKKHCQNFDRLQIGVKNSNSKIEFRDAQLMKDINKKYIKLV